MALYPAAVKKLLPENRTQGGIRPTQVILHSAVDAPGDTSLAGYFGREDIKLESHFFIKNNGTVEQYIDTSVRADANNLANARAISIETEDDGDPNNRPWTKAQLLSIVLLIDWLCDTHDIPRQKCAAWDQPGIGWHSMWGAPSEWTPVRGKTCPGTIRITQVPQIIQQVKAMGSTPPKETFLMALSDAEQKDLYARVKRLTPFAAEEINRNGEKVGDGAIADPSVRWAIESLNILRGLRGALAVSIEAAVAEALAAEGPVDPAAVAEAVVTRLAERIAS